MINSPLTEDLQYILQSGGIREIFRKSILPMYQQHRRDLLRSVALDEPTRRAYVKYGETIRNMIRQMYVDAGMPIPSWFIKEFDLDD